MNGPLVLSEHGDYHPQPKEKSYVSAIFAPQWLTPVERPSLTIRRMESNDRESFLYSMMGLTLRDNRNWA
jgi:hypothetical protein